MRRLTTLALLAITGLFTLVVVQWLLERRRHAPLPVSQAGMLLAPARRFVHPPERTVALFGLRPGDRVLELGPGPGYFTPFASHAVGPDGRVLCVDLQPEMLAILRSRLDSTRANVRLAAGDATRLPLATRSLDGAFLVAVLGEVPDRRQALIELRRVLRPGGTLAICETLTDPDYVFERTLRRLAWETGFEPVHRTRHGLGYVMTFRA